MITITIDGKQVQTEPTKTIIEAAFENGIYIPHFCWHPAFSISGNCRMCLVEVERMPKQVIACSTLCMDGMVVHVDSQKAVDARKAVMEFILINHPLDCPICDEAGECKLQEYTYRYSAGESRFDEEKNPNRKRVELGPNVMFDAERCISCSRCIRFCEEVAGDPQLTFSQRGDRVTITTLPGRKLDNPYSMNVIDVCPVGALTSKSFRFMARAWDMSSTETVCPGCARGCNMKLWVRQNTILRATPRENQAVNDFWMCDAGRLTCFSHVHADTRVTQPTVLRNGAAVAVGIDEAVAAAREALARHQGREIAVIASSTSTTEDLFALTRLAEEVLRTGSIDVVPHIVSGDQDGRLIREDKTPNRAGAILVGAASADGDRLTAIIDGLNGGSIRALLITDPHAFSHPALAEAAKRASTIVAIVSNHTAVTEAAEVVLPAATFAEVDGTFLNCEMHLQRVRPAVNTTPAERRRTGMAVSRLDRFATEFDRWGRMPVVASAPLWKLVTMLAAAWGRKWGHAAAAEVFLEMASRLPALKNHSHATIGRHGVRIEGAEPARKFPYVYSDVHQ